MKILLILLLLCCVIPQSTTAQNTGIGTIIPTAKLQVASAAADSIALKVTVGGNDKLKLYNNGGLAIGTHAPAATNGLTVQGVLQPNDSIKHASKPIVITSVQDSVVLSAGNTRIVLSANGNVRIIASGGGDISIDAGAGDVSIKGSSVNIQASGNASVSSANTTISSQGASLLKGSVVQIGNGNTGFRPTARFGDNVTVAGAGGSIVNGSSFVFIN